MVVTDAVYEDKAIHFLECGLTQAAQVMATLALVEQFKIMNGNTKKLYGAALGWNKNYD